MLNIKKAMRNNRILKSLTGLSRSKFEALVPYFNKIIQEEEDKKIKNDKNRQRASGAGTKHTLNDLEAKLFFILFYLKVYPTFDLMGFIYDVDRSQTNRWVYTFLPILEKALCRKQILPKRKVSDMSELFSLFPEMQDVFIDGTERRTQRPSKDKKQKSYYSGKKKAHTVKNIVINDENKNILFISPTVGGSMHDKKLYDKSELDKLAKEITQWGDTGFKGIDKYGIDVMIPHKKVKGKDLTVEQKEENQIISSIRVVNEQAIGGIKRLRCVNDIYRNKKANIADKFILVSAGIWNLENGKIS
jgi:hypothetical protein